MRLIASSPERDKSLHIAAYLTSLGIENKVEMVSDADWGSSEFGTATYHIWVFNEDQFEQARDTAKAYYSNSDDPQYLIKKAPALDNDLIVSMEPTHNSELNAAIPFRKKRGPKPTAWKQEPMGLVTLYLLVGCCLLYFFAKGSAPIITEKIPNTLPQAPIYFSVIEKELLFDYPYAYEIIDKLIKVYGIEKLQQPEDLPKEGKALLNQYFNTPYWTGYYYEIVNSLRNPIGYKPSDAPLFEKIREGEFWRLFTPTILHANIFHLMFNMMWLAVIGRQLEQRMGRGRYLIFIIATGIITNIIQYFVSGSNFLGFSAILCAMLTFVWVRQKYYPWEGYRLESSTFGFVMFYLFTLLAIQIFSFYSEINFNLSIAPPIANAGHMSGLLIGLLFGRLNFFAWR